MKIKSDFVTNSSSSSFVVIGTTIDVEAIPLEVFQKFQNVKMKFNVTAQNLKDDPYEYLDPMLKGTDLDYSQGCEYGDGELMLGIPYTSMNEDETLGQFKHRVINQIKQIFGMDVTVGHIEEYWMDG